MVWTSTAQESAGLALAERLASGILQSRAAPGTVVASAAELSARHDAGRPVVRQAVRILEQRGVAYMRRGVGGGLVVSSPSPAYAARGLSILIEQDLREAADLAVLPMALDSHLFLDVAPHLNWSACEELRRLARRLDRLPDDEFVRSGAHRQLFSAVRTVSGEPAILLAQRAALECTVDLIPYSVNRDGEGKREISWRLTLETVDALVAGDVARLFACSRRQLALFEANWPSWAQVERDPQLAPKIDDVARPEFQLANNRADRLAREILREIRLLGWKVGERIGSGPEIMERYGGGPDILRQAVLMLQEHGAVRMDRGRRGGLFVAAPDRGRAINAARAYLETSRASSDHMRTFLCRLATQTFDSIHARNPSILSRAAREMTGSGFGPSSSAVALWDAVARLCANPVLRLFAEVISPLLPPDPCAETNLHVTLAALAAGDPAKARRHLFALGTQSPIPLRHAEDRARVINGHMRGPAERK